MQAAIKREHCDLAVTTEQISTNFSEEHFSILSATSKRIHKRMKPCVIVGVAAVLVLLPMKVRGAPQNVITSEEFGKAIEQFQEGIISQYPYEASAQIRGVNIQNCGRDGRTISAALSGLNIFSSQFGVLVDCQAGGNCVRVRVDVPADKRKTDVRVCDLGKSNSTIVHCNSIHFSEST